MENKSKFINLKKEELFFCYSFPLYRYLKMNNFRYLYKDANPDTGKYYFVFERTPELMEAITQFTTEKRNYFKSIGKE